MADCDLLIVGGGISGLSMAHHAVNAGLNTQVLESTQRIGGCLHSHHFADMNNFWLELGAYSCFNSYGNLLTILENLQLFEQLKPRAKVPLKLFTDGATKSITSQLHYLELALAPFRLLGLLKTGRSVAEYYGHIVGKRNYTDVFEPAFDAVLSQSAAKFPADHLFGERVRRKDTPRGFTFPDGLQTIATHLAAQEGIQIQSGRAVHSIQRDGNELIACTQDRHYSARYLCLATPITVTRQLLSEAFPDIAKTLAPIEAAKIETVGVALPKTQVKLPLFNGLIGRGQAFFSVVSRDTIPDTTYRGFAFHFRPDVLDKQEQLACISRVLDIPESKINPNHVIRKTNQLPALRVGHNELAYKVDSLLADSPLALTGNFFSGIAIEDCVTRSRLECERLLR